MPPNDSAAPPSPLPVADWRAYVALARPSHWIKHLFIVPGVFLAALLHRRHLDGLALEIVLGFASAAAIASANYVLNEWLDARSDAHHPLKSSRSAVSLTLSRPIVIAEYLLLAAAGMGLALAVSPLFAVTSALFLVAAWIYNVPPVRTKDRPYLDVLSESLNNPIRLTLGWAMVDSVTLPPGSVLAAYWMGGAFLMAIKRLAEYRTVVAIAGIERLAAYRRSFAGYDESSLLVSSFVYSQLAAFFLAVFLVKYRIEYLLSIPLFAALFAAYLALGLRERSAAQTPERLFRERRLVLLMVALAAVVAVLTFVDLPFLGRLTDPHYIRLSFD